MLAMPQTSAKRRRIVAPGVHEPDAGLSSNCFAIGDFVVLNGLTARDGDGNVVGLGDAYAQAAAVFRRMQALMDAAGGAMADIIKMNCYLADIRHREDFVRARRDFFTGDFPPCVVLGGLAFTAPEILIEVDAWALVGSGE
jgi:enamine deaminase RidA (YjgF/YER057c/UK114 family)